MEPLSSAAIAIAALIFNKAFEKTGEHLGESFSTHLGKFLKIAKKKALSKTQAIEAGAINADYTSAVHEIETAIDIDAEIAAAVIELSRIVESDSILYDKVQKIAALEENENNVIQNQSKLAEKIGLVVQGGEVNIDNFSL